MRGIRRSSKRGVAGNVGMAPSTRTQWSRIWYRGPWRLPAGAALDGLPADLPTAKLATPVTTYMYTYLGT